jgi:hypothetical protein
MVGIVGKGKKNEYGRPSLRAGAKSHVFAVGLIVVFL